MNLGSCSREKEVSELLKQGHWPHACPDELRVHVAGCSACGDVVRITTTFQAARTQAASAAPLQSPGLLWWRAQLRRRNTAIERVARPLLGAQIFALAVTLATGAAFLAWQVRQGFSLMAWLAELPRAIHLEALLSATLPRFDGSLWLLVPILATLALLGGVAVYLASEKQ
jgi:hypothetical protein